MIIKCEFCGKLFETNYKKRFCNRQCSARFTNNNSERKKLLSDKNKEYWKNNPDKLTKRSERIKESWTDTRKKEHAQSVKERYEDVMYRQNISEKTKLKWKDFDYAERMRNAIIRMWKDPVTRRLLTEKRRKAWQNPEYKKRMKKVFKDSWTSERKNNFSVLMIEKWRNSKWVEQRLTRIHGIYKEYKLPSGTIVKLQGYEPYALDKLLKEFHENDIVIGVKEINKHITKIEYEYHGKIRRYYPDFYIKSTNTIIEVKSPWTFSIQSERNMLKKQACLKNNYNFIFLIIE